MAHQFYWTSSTEGLNSYVGFQFVAASPEVPGQLLTAAGKYLTYQTPDRPPPEADPYPVAFGYARSGEVAFYVCCRYAGNDYAGRPGNFFGHVVVPADGELPEARPIEMWDAPWWATPAESYARELDPLSVAETGGSITPDNVSGALRDRGSAALGLLDALVDATLQALDGQPGKLILVSDSVRRVAQWIGAVSYSLPLSLVDALSFTTYTAQPGAMPYLLCGTARQIPVSPDASVFDVDRLTWPRPKSGSRFSALVSSAWQPGRLLQIDLVGELVDAIRSQPAHAPDVTAAHEREVAAALVSTCFRAAIDPGTRELAVECLTRYAARVTDEIWLALAEETTKDGPVLRAAWKAAGWIHRHELADQLGATCVRTALRTRDYETILSDPGRLSLTVAAGLADDAASALDRTQTIAEVSDLARLAEAVKIGLARDHVANRSRVVVAADPSGVERALRAVPGRYREAMSLGLTAGLEEADDRARAAALTPEVCSALKDRVWWSTPRVGAIVLAELAVLAPRERVGYYATLLEVVERANLPQTRLGELLERVWSGARLTDAERISALAAARPRRSATIRQTVAAFMIRHWDPHTISDPSAREVADAVVALLPEFRTSPAVLCAQIVKANSDVKGASPTETLKSARYVEGLARQLVEPTKEPVVSAVFGAHATKLWKTWPDVGLAAWVLTPNGADIPQWIGRWLVEGTPPTIPTDELMTLVSGVLAQWARGKPDEVLEARLRELVAATKKVEKFRARLLKRSRATGEQFDALMRGADR